MIEETGHTEALMTSLLDEAVPPPTAAPQPPEGGGPPAGGEPPAPPEPPRSRIWERPGFRRAVWVVAVLLALLLIGVIFPPNFWRF